MRTDLKFNASSRRAMILFLLREEFAAEPPEYTFVRVVGFSP